MLDNESGDTIDTTGATAPSPTVSSDPTSEATAGAAAKKAPAKRARKTAKTAPAASAEPGDGAAASTPAASTAAPRRRTRKSTAAPPAAEVETAAGSGGAVASDHDRASSAGGADAQPAGASAGTPSGAPAVLFQPPDEAAVKPRRARKAATSDAAAGAGDPADSRGAAETRDDRRGDGDGGDGAGAAGSGGEGATGEAGGDRPARRRRGRRGRGRGGAGAEGTGTEGLAEDEGGSDRGEDPADRQPSQPVNGDAETADDGADSAAAEPADGAPADEDGTGPKRRRRRRRRRTGEGGEAADGGDDDGVETVVHVREPRAPQQGGRSGRGDADDGGVRGVKGSTRIEAKRQRRREGRDSGRRRPPIITEAEFLARRESVDRVMVVRQTAERTQIGVLEDGILVEHYVARKDQTSMVGNVYLGKVQNVLPSMEAAFVDIGRGRNGVLYAGEVNYDASALEGRPPRIEQALKSGQSVLVQVTKDPIGHKGARLTSQVSLPGRYMVYVPDGRLSGISRKLPDTERSRLKGILKRLTPEDAGVIIRTAAEGASEEELERDLNRLHAQWEDIQKKVQSAAAPVAIYSEPDVVIRVIRDIFNEDFKELVVSGDDEWDTVDNYVRWVAPDLAERTRKWTEPEDVFAAYRIDEQLAKALDRKVWLPSGGYLIIDRTEAMVVVDVNTGKFTGKGGNLEETVTKNNLEAAEEIVRQLRLRDLGGIIVIDFIDMVLESNRELVLRRLTECLGRDRTRHQVAEVTSLGLVQMTRKRVGQGLLEAFSETCKECGGRGVILTLDPVATKRPPKPKPPAGVKGVVAAEAAGPSDGDAAADAPAQPAPKRSRKRAAAKPAEPVQPTGEPAAPSAEQTEPAAAEATA